MLQNKAIIGKIKYGMPQIKRSAKYVAPPPNPTLEYNVAVNKNNIVSTYINSYKRLTKTKKQVNYG